MLVLYDDEKAYTEYLLLFALLLTVTVDKKEQGVLTPLEEVFGKAFAGGDNQNFGSEQRIDGYNALVVDLYKVQS